MKSLSVGHNQTILTSGGAAVALWGRRMRGGGSFKDQEQDRAGPEGGGALGDQPPTLEEEGFTLDFLVFLPWFTMKSA